MVWGGEVPGAAHPVHSSSVDGQRNMLGVKSPEVNNKLLHLLSILREITVSAPHSQVDHLAPVVCLICAADKSHYRCVVHKLVEDVGAVHR